MKISEHDEDFSNDDLARAFELLTLLPDDFLPNGCEQLPLQEREGL